MFIFYLKKLNIKWIFFKSSFPDRELREHAVRSLETFSPELIYLYLPQLLEALKFEFTNNSALFCMFLKFANKSIRFAHKLFWYCFNHYTLIKIMLTNHNRMYKGFFESTNHVQMSQDLLNMSFYLNH